MFPDAAAGIGAGYVHLGRCRLHRRWADSTDGVEGREMNYLLATNSYHAWRRFITNLDRLSMPEPDRRDYLRALAG